jgi:acetoin utilization protein AcuB
MNLFAPVSKLMTDHKHLVTIDPETPLSRVKEIFDTHSFHHLPVVHFREIVGIVSKMDLEHFMGGLKSSGHTAKLLEHTKAEEIMTKRLGKVESDTRLNVVVEIFTINRFHALPVVDDGELVGIITPYDILKALGEEKPEDPSMVYENL